MEEYLTPEYWAKRPCPAGSAQWSARLGAYGPNAPHWFREPEERCTNCDLTPRMLARRAGLLKEND